MSSAGSSVSSMKFKDVSLEEIQAFRKEYIDVPGYSSAKIREIFMDRDPGMKVVRNKVIWYLENKLDGGTSIKDIKNATLYIVALEGKYMRSKMCDGGDWGSCNTSKDHVVKAFIRLRIALKNNFRENEVDVFFKDYAPELLYVVTEARQAGGKTRRSSRGVSRKVRRGSRKMRRSSRKAKSSRKTSRGSRKH